MMAFSVRLAPALVLLLVLPHPNVAQHGERDSFKERLSKFRRQQFEGTREDHYAFFMKHEENRRRSLERVVKEHKQALRDHKSGRRRLSTDEIENVLRQLRNSVRKLKAREMETHEERQSRFNEYYEKLQSMISFDYIDFERTGLV